MREPFGGIFSGGSAFAVSRVVASTPVGVAVVQVGVQTQTGRVAKLRVASVSEMHGRFSKIVLGKHGHILFVFARGLAQNVLRRHNLKLKIKLIGRPSSFGFLLVVFFRRSTKRLALFSKDGQFFGNRVHDTFVRIRFRALKQTLHETFVLREIGIRDRDLRRTRIRFQKKQGAIYAILFRHLVGGPSGFAEEFFERVDAFYDVLEGTILQIFEQYGVDERGVRSHVPVVDRKT